VIKSILLINRFRFRLRYGLRHITSSRVLFITTSISICVHHSLLHSRKSRFKRVILFHGTMVFYR